jgi:hypothetical protein
MSELPEYSGWRSVPAHLVTASRLKALDLPREPTEPVAIVTASNWRGKQEAFDLYDLTNCPPTAASAKQLETAAGRRKFASCTDCGARPDTGLSQVTGRCETCLHIEQLRKTQREAQRSRDECAAWAAKRIADPKTLVAWIDEHTPPPAPSGRTRNPVAHTLTAVTAQGDPVLRLSYRLTGIGPRVRAVPEGAVARDEAATALATLGERYFVTWTHSNLWHLVQLATGRGLSYLGTEGCEMDSRVLWWRGDIDPRHPSHPRAAIAPGNADRLALVLRRMAASGAAASADE